MKRRKTPAEKKALAYRQDHRVKSEYPHAFRRQWPRKKRGRRRRERRKVRQLLRQVLPPSKQDARADFPLRPVRRPLLKKSGVTPLGPWVQERLQQRVQRVAWNFFKRPYQAAHHREQFIKFLETLVEGQGAYVRNLAVVFAEILAAPKPHPPYGKIYADRRQDWFRAFFRDEPAWEERIRAWIDQNSR